MAEVHDLDMLQNVGYMLQHVEYIAGVLPWHINTEGAIGVAIQLSAKGQAGV